MEVDLQIAYIVIPKLITVLLIISFTGIALSLIGSFLLVFAPSSHFKYIWIMIKIFVISAFLIALTSILGIFFHFDIDFNIIKISTIVSCISIIITSVVIIQIVRNLKWLKKSKENIYYIKHICEESLEELKKYGHKTDRNIHDVENPVGICNDILDYIELMEGKGDLY